MFKNKGGCVLLKAIFLGWILLYGVYFCLVNSYVYPVTFGLCVSNGKRPHMHMAADGHKVRWDASLDVENEYNKDFWGSVSFRPVPAFEINTHDPLLHDVYISGSVHSGTTPWDVYIWDLFVRVLEKNNDLRHGMPLVVDVGSNLGYFSLLAASMGYPVLAFEPMNRNVAKFLSSVKRNRFEDKVTIFQNAVSFESGRLVQLKETHNSNQGNGQIQGYVLPGKSNNYGLDHVSTVRLDDIIQENVLLMKIDVEGFETAVLDGAKRLVCWNIVRYITLEVSDNTKKSKQCSFSRLSLLFNDLGYSISDVVDKSPVLSPLDYMHFPPNILLTLRDTSQAPGQRANMKDICGSV